MPAPVLLCDVPIKSPATPSPDPWHPPEPGLEEVVLEGENASVTALGFLIARLGPTARKLVLVVPRHVAAWAHARLLGQGLRRFGLAPRQLLVVTPSTEALALWALEEILRSGTAALAIGAAERTSMVVTRRLDFAARQSGASAVLLRQSLSTGISAARRRWRVRALPSAPHPWDPQAPGPPRWRAELIRRRDGALGSWDLEWNDATDRLDLVAGLADLGLAAPEEFRAGFRTAG